MANVVKTNELPVINDLTNAKVIGLDKDGVDGQLPLDRIVRNSIGDFKLTDAAPTGQLPNQSVKLIGSGNGSKPQGTYTNLLKASATPIVIPTPAAGNAIFDAVARWDGTYWQPSWQELPLPVQDLTNYPNKQEAALKTDILTSSPTDITKPLTAGYLWPTSGATPVANSSYKCSPLITTTPGATFTFQNISSSLSNTAIARYYAADGTYIGVSAGSALVAITGGYKLTISTNTNVAKVGFNFMLADADAIIVNTGSTITVSKIKDALLPDMTVYADKQSYVANSDIYQPGYGNLSVITGTGYYSATGTAYAITASTSYKHTSIIPVTAGMTFKLFGLSASLANSNIGRLFDASGNVLGTVAPSNLTDITGGKQYIVPGTSGITGIGFHFSTAEADAVVVSNQDKLIKAALLPSGIGTDDAARSNIEANKWYLRGNAPKKYTTTGAYKIGIEGQSNADGRATTLPGDLPALLTGVYIFNKTTKLYEAANLGVNSGAYVNTATTFAFDWRLYQLLQAYKGANVYSVKGSLGGCCLGADTSGLSGVPGSFNVDFEAITAANSSAVVMTSVWEKTFLDSVAKDATDGIDKDLKCIIYFQGESDRAAIRSTFPGQYYQNLKNKIAYDRGVAKNPKLKYVIVGIHVNDAYYDATVRAAQVQVASELSFVTFFNPDSLTFSHIGDGVHLDAACCDRYANAIFNIIKDF